MSPPPPTTRPATERSAELTFDPDVISAVPEAARHGRPRVGSRLGNRATQVLIERLRTRAGGGVEPEQSEPARGEEPVEGVDAADVVRPASADIAELRPVESTTDRDEATPVESSPRTEQVDAAGLVADRAAEFTEPGQGAELVEPENPGDEAARAVADDETAAATGSETVDGAAEGEDGSFESEPDTADAAALGAGPPQGGPDLAEWRSRVAARSGTISAPRLARSAAGGPAVAARGRGLRQSRSGRRDAIPEEADQAVSPSPEGHEPPAAPPDDPVPEATALVDREVGHELDPATMPDLAASPRGTQALVRDPLARRAEPEAPPAERTESVPPGRQGQPEPTPQDAATVERIEEAAQSPVPEPVPGTAVGATIEDTPAPERPPLPPRSPVRNIMQAVIARLLANPRSQAQPIVDAARNNAYPNEVLRRTYQDIGNDRLDGLTEALTTNLRLIATDAGIAAEDLDATVAAEQARVEAAAGAATDVIGGEAAAESEALAAESGEEVAEVEAAEDAQGEHATAVVQATAGEGSPEVIDARADAQVRRLNRRVANLRFDYGQAKDRRHTALDRARALQSQAYDRTSRDDQQAIDDAVDGPQTLTEGLEKAAVALWANHQKESVAQAVIRLKAAATTQAEGFQEAVTTAGSDANEQIRAWAAAEKGETRDWWGELFALFSDWRQQANVEAANWSVVRAGEARDATVQNMGLLSAFVEAQGETVNLETNDAFNQMSAEQQAVIRAYFASPPDSRDSLGAVAAGLRFRLAAEQQAPMIEAMKREVLAKPDSEADNLASIGAAETPGFDAERIGDQLYQAMFGGVTGLGTDEEQIYRNLTGLTAVQGRAVRAKYNSERGRDLDDDLAGELDADNALIRAQAALAGDPVMETVGALNEAMAGVGTDEDTIMRMLRGKTAEQRARIVEEYRRRYRVDLDAELRSEMSSHELERSEALLAGDTARADAIAIDQAMHGGWTGWGTDEAAIESVYSDIRADVARDQVPDGRGGLRPMTQEEMEAEIGRRNLGVEASYDQRYGSPGDQESALRAAYRSELSGPDLDLATALADNDLVAADAARLERERRGLWTDDDVVNGILEDQYGRSLEGVQRDPALRAEREALQRRAATEDWDPYRLAQAERELDREIEARARQGAARNMAALEERYDTRYSRWGSGGLQVMIAFNMSGTDQEKARRLVEQGGYLSPAQRIDYATRGVGTDEADFDRAVAGRTRAEIDEINLELARMNRPPVEELAASELSGRERFDMDMRLQGVPENAEQEIAQARQRTNWELRNSPIGGHERQIMVARMAAMERQYAVINDPNADQFERQRALDQFRQRGSGVQSGIESYRAQVDAVADAVATVAALTAAITVTVLTGGVAGAVLGALYAAAATIVTKTVLKGAAYGVEDMAVDAAVGVVDAAAAFATAGVGNALLRVATSQGGRVSRLAGTRLAATLSRMASSGSRAQRMMAHGLAEGVEGAAGALPSALAGNMLNDKNWDGNPLTNILGGTLMETGMGGLMGGGLGSFSGFRVPRVDPPAPRTGDILAHRGTPADRLDAWNTHRAQNPDADMRSFLRQYDQQISDRLAAESVDAGVQRALRGELLAGIPPRQRGQFANTRIEIMSDADFRAFTRSDSANAVTIIDSGQPRVILRDGAPPGVLREEGIHLHQIADPDLGRLARRLDEGRLRNWDSLSLGEKMELYAIKVDLEIDAQVRLIDSLEIDIRRARSETDVRALRRQRDVAADSLDTLRRRAAEVGDVGPLERMAMSRGILDPPPYLDQPARLFNKIADSAAPPPGGRRARGYTAEGVGDDFTHGPLPLADDVPVMTGRGGSRSEGEVLSSYAGARRSTAGKNPATSAVRGEGDGPYIRDNLYRGERQRRVVRRLQEHGVVEVSDSGALRILDPDRYMKWLERSYRRHGDAHLDPTVQEAVRRYITRGDWISGHGISPHGGGSFAGSLPGTHAEVLAINDLLVSGRARGIDVATVRAKSGDHFAACLHCAGIIDELAATMPELRVWTGRSIAAVPAGSLPPGSGLSGSVPPVGSAAPSATASPTVPTAAAVTPRVDPGGRGNYHLADDAMTALSDVEATRLRELQSQMPASEAELAELVQLRTKAAGGAFPAEPGTPEHMLDRWLGYKGGPWEFGRWVAGHPSRMANSLAGPAAEVPYGTGLATEGVTSRPAVLQSASGQRRQVDILVEAAPDGSRELIQIKAGSESLTTTDRISGGASRGSSSHSNRDALAIDREFVEAGDRVTWVFEKRPSGPLVKEAVSLGVDVVIRVDGPDGVANMQKLMRRAGMSPEDMAKVVFVEGTTEALVRTVVARVKARNQ